MYMQCTRKLSTIFVHPLLTQQPIYKITPWLQGNVFTSETKKSTWFCDQRFAESSQSHLQQTCCSSLWYSVDLGRRAALAFLPSKTKAIIWEGEKQEIVFRWHLLVMWSPVNKTAPTRFWRYAVFPCTSFTAGHVLCCVCVCNPCFTCLNKITVLN